MARLLHLHLNGYVTLPLTLHMSEDLHVFLVAEWICTTGHSSMLHRLSHVHIMISLIFLKRAWQAWVVLKGNMLQ